MDIREATDADLDDVLAVERAAFGGEEEPRLVRELLVDASARPVLSLLALQGERPVGHVLFTNALLAPAAPASLALLAPLAVLPAFQGQGIGGALVRDGLERLRASGVDLVFVLGYPAYYTRFGFTPAGRQGFDAPFPIPEKNADAWMVLALRPDALRRHRASVRCADALAKPQYWRE